MPPAFAKRTSHNSRPKKDQGTHMRIAIIGTGYVGLVVGTCFAENGNRITCVDLDEDKIKGLKNGVIPIYEPGLKELIARNMEEGRLSFTTDTAEAVKNSKVCFIAVGTR